MDDSLSNCISGVCEILNKHSVEYLMVGGSAVAYYGYFRLTTYNGVEIDKHDLDFWYKPNYTNYCNLLNALEELKIDVKKFRDETANPKKSFFRYEFDNFKIDFLPEIDGVPAFTTSYRQRENLMIDGVSVTAISLKDLIRNKEATGRPKDFEDIAMLKQRNGGNPDL